MSDGGQWRGYNAGGPRSGKGGDRGGQRSGLDDAFGRSFGGDDDGKQSGGRKGAMKGNDSHASRKVGGGFKGGSRDAGDSWANSGNEESRRFGGRDNWREEPNSRQDHWDSDRKPSGGYKGGSRGGGDSWANNGSSESRRFGTSNNWRDEPDTRQDKWDSNRNPSGGYKGGSKEGRESWGAASTRSRGDGGDGENRREDQSRKGGGGSKGQVVPRASGDSWRPELRAPADGGHRFDDRGNNWREENHRDRDGKGSGGYKGDSKGGKNGERKGGASGKGNSKGQSGDSEDGPYRNSTSKGKAAVNGKGKDSEREFSKGKGAKNGTASRGAREDEVAETGSRQQSGGKGSKAGKASGGSRGKKGARSKGQGGAEDDEDDEDEDTAPTSSAQRGSRGTGVVSSSHLSEKTFSSLPVSAATKRAMAEGFGYEFMTAVQAAAIFPLLEGRDVVARARTGTGKTLAFLIPIIESIREHPGGVGGAISALVLSPTRELAQQIADEAKELLSYHKGLGVACFYGGTNPNSDRRDLANRPVDLLVATPGRIQDHLENTSGFHGRMQHLKFLALDEGDQLLDMGFRDSILRILRMLPSAGQRQGALFSATFPAAVGEIAKLALLADHMWLDTVRPDEEVTPDQIDQSVAISTIEDMVWFLWAALSAEIARHPQSYKIMVFFVAARLTQFYSELFTQAGREVFEIHSRKSQAHRTKAAESFRTARRGIVFSSDVLARGLDFPDITAVIQVGVPSSRDQYIHRLGRTGRAGKSGRCILLLHDFEQYFLKTVKDLPVQRLSADPWPGTPDPPDSIYRAPEFKTGCQAYQAWLGYYNSAKGLGWPKDRLVQEATRFAQAINVLTPEGLPPPITKKTVGNMGLKGVAGLNLVSQLPYGD